MTSKVTTALVALAMIAGLTGDVRGQSQNELIEQRVLARGEHDRALLTYRDGSHVWTLRYR